MDNILVGIIVAMALLFCIRSFIKIYRGQGGCNCSSGNCSSSCGTREKTGHCSQVQPFKIIDK
ncbi:MAG: FeoB-associated Cys-rich membrane protein [Deltaproteobacteria bacterium]|nr:MAG: FeoB-associated Cys-rich membrane protein [Deltaproteobacteria bacterium]